LAEQKIVVLGAGYGGLRATQRLSDLLGKQESYKLTLINKHNFHMFMTQLHETAAGSSDVGDLMVPLDEVLEGRNVEFIKGWVTKINLADRNVLVNHDTLKVPLTVPFSYLIIALGSEPEYFNIEGLKEHSMSLRSLYSARDIYRRVKGILKRASAEPPGELRSRMLTFVIGGGGLTGVEFAGELAEQLRNTAEQYSIRPEEYKIIIVEGAKELLPGLPTELAQYARQTLEELGVEVMTGELIKKVTQDTIQLASGKEIHFFTLIWSGGVRGNKVLAASGLKTESRGRVPVNQYLQYVDDTRVYVVGDSGFSKDPKTDKPVLPTAQAALQQGELAAYNIYADITGQEKKIYFPSVIGTLISIGRRRGIGQVKSFRLKGTTAAWLKELIPIKYRYSMGGLKMVSSKLVT